MSEGGVTQVSPDSGGVGLSAATEAQGPGGARAEERAEEWAGPQEAPVRKWVLRAPCGTVVLDPRVSPQDVARVQALLREVSAGLEPGPAETGQALPGSAPPPVGAAQAVVAAAGPRGPEPGLEGPGRAGSEVVAPGAEGPAQPVSEDAGAGPAGAGQAALEPVGPGEEQPVGPEPVGPEQAPGPEAAETGVWLDPDDLPQAPEPPAAPGPEPAPEPVASPGPAQSAAHAARTVAYHLASAPGPGGLEDAAAGPRLEDSSASAAAPEAAVAAPDAAVSARSARSARSAGVAGGDSGAIDLPSSTGSADSQAGPEGKVAEPAPEVLGAVCLGGHLNPPGSITCLRCASPVTPGTVRGPRPPLATLEVSTGEVIAVNGSVVVGRAPKEQNGPALLVTVPSPTHLVSRSHLLITTTGWTVLACDLGSSNGTVLVRPGESPVLIATALPTPLVVGDLLDIGDGVTLRLKAPQ